MSSEIFSVGQNVTIHRSNGERQIAQISELKSDNLNIIVEWTSDGQKRGKEISFHQLLNWNPELTPMFYHERPELFPAEKSRKTIFTKAPIKLNIPQNIQAPIEKPLINEQNKIRAHSIIPGSLTKNITAMDENIDHFPVKRNNSATRKSCLIKEPPKMLQKQISIKAINVQNKEKSSPSNHNMTSQNSEFLDMILNYRHNIYFKPIVLSDRIKNDTKIVVCVRKRPLNQKEIARKEIDVVSVPDYKSLFVHECKLKVDLTKYLENQKFSFDYVFDENSNNELVYRFTAEPLIDCVFEGGRATCFAYGQTGSGKTYTMSGDFNNPNSYGVFDFTIRDVFSRLKSPSGKNLQAFVSLFEIYGGKIFDLLNKKKLLRMLEDTHGQVQICELTEINVTTMDDAINIVRQGNEIRTSGSTSANPHSSRSHSIFQLLLKKKPQGRSKKSTLFGKFSLIDLAGNERGQDTTSCDRQTRLEGAEINKSLLALKECIRALCKKGAHLPFRASKLTQILRDSFISENSRTCMIATVSPGQSCTENTMNTLRYTDRVKEIEVDKRNELFPNSSDNKVDFGNDNELAMLCSKNDNLYKFHKTVEEIYTAEDQMYQEHKALVSQYTDWHKEEDTLIDSIEKGYDNIDEYVSKLDNIVCQRLESFNSLKNKIENVKSQLNEEEVASKRIKHLPTF